MENIEMIKKFGLTVKKIRVENNLSQEKLADITQLHRTYISEVERGIRNLSFKNIVKIANALGLKPSELFEAMEKEEILNHETE